MIIINDKDGSIINKKELILLKIKIWINKVIGK